MRRLSMTISMFAFFVLAGVGWASGVPVWVCSMRAVAGAFALYVMLQMASRLAASVLASAAVRNEAADSPRSDSGGNQ